MYDSNEKKIRKNTTRIGFFLVRKNLEIVFTMVYNNHGFHSWLVENTKVLRTGICQKFRWLFRRFEDTKNSEIN